MASRYPRKKHGKKKRRDLEAELLVDVREAMKNGRVPWEKMWTSPDFTPRSVASGKPYQGANAMWLHLSAMGKGYSSPWWLSYDAAIKLGGHVRAKEKHSPVIFWNIREKKDSDGKVVKNSRGTPQAWVTLGAHAVFNLDQCELPDEVRERLDARLQRLTGRVRNPDGSWLVAPLDEDANARAADALSSYLEREKVEVKHGGSQAYYHPKEDRIQMPEKRDFNSPEAYYFTLGHESIHSTGHSSRLDRGLDTKLAPFGSADYSREELVAEIGSSLIAGELGTLRPELEINRTSYLQGWLSKLEDDPKALLWALGRAGKARTLVLGEVEGEAEDTLAGADQVMS